MAGPAVRIVDEHFHHARLITSHLSVPLGTAALAPPTPVPREPRGLAATQEVVAMLGEGAQMIDSLIEDVCWYAP